MKLQTNDGKLTVLDAHHDSVASPGRNLKLRWESVLVDDQGMIATGQQWAGQSVKHTFAVVMDLTCLTVDWTGRSHNRAPKAGGNCLVPQADTQYWHFVGKVTNDIQRTPGFRRSAGAGGYHNGVRTQSTHILYTGLIISSDNDVLVKTHQIASQIVSEAIVVVDQEDHCLLGGRFKLTQSMQHSARLVPGLFVFLLRGRLRHDAAANRELPPSTTGSHGSYKDTEVHAPVKSDVSQ